MVERSPRDGELVSIDLIVEAPGLSTDYQQVDFDNLYEELHEVDEAGLRRWIEEQPATVEKKRRPRPAIRSTSCSSDRRSRVAGFVRAGWHVPRPCRVVRPGKPSNFRIRQKVPVLAHQCALRL